MSGPSGQNDMQPPCNSR